MTIMKRRNFIKAGSLGAAGAVLASSNRFSGVLGANDSINIAVIGTRGRGKALTKAAGICENVRVSHVCDVDTEILDEHLAYSEQELGYKPESETDFRRILENKDVDAIAVAIGACQCSGVATAIASTSLFSRILRKSVSDSGL